MKSPFFDSIHLPHLVWHKHPQVETPRMMLGNVFDVVQLSRTLLDSMTFVDSVPKYSPRIVQKAFADQYAASMSISKFVADYFIVPSPVLAPKAVPGANEPAKSIEAYINSMWETLTRGPDTGELYSSLLPLPHRYVVPGGRFRSVYYWDSYFTMLGLKESGRIDLLEEMVKNFAFLILTYGFIPNGNRSYYLTRSQPPVFALMVSLLAEVKGKEVYTTYLSPLLLEHSYWMQGIHDPVFQEGSSTASHHVVRMPGGEILNRYFDESNAPREEGFAEDVALAREASTSREFYREMRAGAESGWDYTSRWFADGKTRETIRTTDIVPVDLNAFLVMMETIIAEACIQDGKLAEAEQFTEYAKHRSDAIRTYCWNEEQKWYVDCVLSEEKQSPYLSLAGMTPLFAGIATKEEAEKTATTLETMFLKKGGLVSTPVETGEQWDAPNGWAPLQYLAVAGLERYGISSLAETVATRWCHLVISTFRKTGTLLEKYNVVNDTEIAGGGEYPIQDGFGWTNGTLLALMHRYHITGE